MSTTLGEILLGLDESSQLELAQSFVPRIFSTGNDNSSLSELLATIFIHNRDHAIWKGIISDLKLKLIERLNSESEALGIVISPLFKNIPEYHAFVLQSAADVLNPESKSDKSVIDRYLNLLDEIFIQVPVLKISTSLENYLFHYLQSFNANHASLASKVICHYILTLEKVQTELLWSNVKQSIELSKDQQTAQRRRGQSFNRLNSTFRIWLRWTSRNDLLSDQYFISLLQSNDYWLLLQRGLTSQSADCKKYALHILSRSVQAISESSLEIDIEYMKYKRSITTKFSIEWKRYITLVEIVSIDTSINQTEDSVSDIISLLSKESVLPPIWAISLLSTAISSTNEHIRQFIAGIILAMDVKDLTIFKHQPLFIKDVLLPYYVLAVHFTTIETSEHNYSCPHGDLLSQFVARLLLSLEDNDAKDMTRHILGSLYGNRLIFDPSRIYVSKGIRNGLKGREILTEDENKELFKLNTGTVETLFRKQILYDLFVEIMLLTDLNNANVATWFSYLSTFLTNCPRHGDIYTERIGQHILKYDKYEIFKGLLNEDVNISVYLSVLLNVELHSEDEITNLLAKLSPTQLSHLYLSPYRDLVTKDIFETHLPSLLCESFKTSLHSKTMTIELRNVIFHILKEGDQSNWIVDVAMDTDLAFLSSIGFSSLKDILELSILGKKGNVEEIYTYLKKTQGKAIDEDILTCAYIFITGADNDLLLSPEALDLYEQHFNSSGYKLRLSLCEYLYSLFKNAKGSIINEASEHVMALSQSMWFSVVEERLSASERELHRTILACIFDTKIVKLDDEFSIQTLEHIAESVVELSYSRRGILSALSPHLVKNPNVLWIARVLVSIYTTLPTDYHMFKLETVIGRMTDSDEDSFVYQSKPAHNSYIEWYGKEEISARIECIEYFSKFANVNETSKDIFNHIRHSEKYHIFNPKARTDGKEELVRIYCFQILLILSKTLDVEYLLPFVRINLIQALDKEALPLVKVFIEWIIAEVITRHISASSDVDNNQLVQELIFQPLNNTALEPRTLVPIERIGLIIGLALRKQLVDSQFFQDYFKTYFQSIAALSTSNKVAIRHSSISLVYGLQTILQRDDKLKQTLKDYTQIINAVTTLALSLGSVSQYRTGEQSIWDLHNDFNLLGICGGVLRRVSERQMPAIKKDEFVDYINDKSRFDNTSTDQVPILPPTTVDYPPFEPTTQANSGPVTISSNLTIDRTKQLSTTIQTKSGAWSSIVDEMDGDGRNANINRGELIVLASLVDKAPNLGGICRLSDVLGAKLLCLNDMSVTDNFQFKTVAVSADRWMPMKEVKESQIVTYLRQMKKEGYTLIGLEQTDNSVQLTSELKFPRKSLILLGRERLGIDGELLAELDFCVEIKQVGVIRSMNIQTATAVVVHAYSSQHC